MFEDFVLDTQRLKELHRCLASKVDWETTREDDVEDSMVGSGLYGREEGLHILTPLQQRRATCTNAIKARGF